MPEFKTGVDIEKETVKTVVEMITKLRTLSGSDSIYIFSPYYKPVDVNMPTMFGVLANFPSWEVFSEEKIKGFKDLVNQYPKLLTGFVRIGDSVYQAQADHEYKTLPRNKGREIIKALVSRAAKVGRFDLSMMDPSWLKHLDSHRETVATHPEHSMNEADEAKEGFALDNINSRKVAIDVALDLLKEQFGPFKYTHKQVIDIERELGESVMPLKVELTMHGDGIQIVGQNDIGVGLFNDNGVLFWEF